MVVLFIKYKFTYFKNLCATMTNAFGWCINLKKRRRKLFLKITAYEGVLSRFVGHHRSIYSICLLILNYTCDWGGGYWVLRGWSVGSLFFSATRDGAPTVVPNCLNPPRSECHYFFQSVSVSGYFMRLDSKVCQTVAGISIMSQFHEFLNLIFGGFLQFGPWRWWH